MKIAAASLHRYDLPLVRPLTPYDGVTAPKSRPTRSGLILRLTDEDGAEGYGDIAPLPGTSHETLDEAQDYATRWLHWIHEMEVLPPRPLLAHASAAMTWRGPYTLPPSVQFGVDCALLALLAEPQHGSFADVLSTSHRPRVAVNALLACPTEEIENTLQQLLAQGYTAIKLKVGHRTLDEDIDAVKLVRAVAGGDIALRLDANRAWDFEQATLFAEGIRDARIEYIEEPLREPVRLPNFVQATGLAIALDETLSDDDLDLRAFAPLARCAKALVAKPTLLGGLMTLATLDALALELSIPLVISSVFESGIGTAALAQWAASLQSANTHAGLGTGTWFAGDALVPPLHVVDGHTTLEDTVAAKPVLVQMQEVAHA